MVAGHGTFINDMLLRCGLQNVFDEGDARYPEITPRSSPSPTRTSSCSPQNPIRSRRNTWQELNMICPGTPVRIVDGELFSWYGSRLLRPRPTSAGS
jgi:hypothetical protein